MTVTHVRKDPEALTMTITAAFDATIERVWEMWADPRKLEQWWGPPMWPATFVDHDLRAGGRVNYFMTGPGGEKSRGWWRVLAAEPPHRLEFEDGFADDAGNPNLAMPVMTIRVQIAAQDRGTSMTVETAFPSREAMEQVLAMGMEEGLSLAIGQIDDVLRTGAVSR
jgi:uncharacterized protein YndB with AHSA1/START domain